MYLPSSIFIFLAPAAFSYPTQQTPRTLHGEIALENRQDDCTIYCDVHDKDTEAQWHAFSLVIGRQCRQQDEGLTPPPVIRNAGPVFPLSLNHEPPLAVNLPQERSQENFNPPRAIATYRAAIPQVSGYGTTLGNYWAGKYKQLGSVPPAATWSFGRARRDDNAYCNKCDDNGNCEPVDCA